MRIEITLENGIDVQVTAVIRHKTIQSRVDEEMDVVTYAVKLDKSSLRSNRDLGRSDDWESLKEATEIMDEIVATIKQIAHKWEPVEKTE